MDAKPSSAGKAFDELARRLVAVPKKELDRRLRLNAERKAKKKRKK